MERRSRVVSGENDPGRHRNYAYAAETGKADPDLDWRHIRAGAETRAAARRVARVALYARASRSAGGAAARRAPGSGFRGLVALRMGRPRFRRVAGAAPGLSRGRGRTCAH